MVDTVNMVFGTIFVCAGIALQRNCEPRNKRGIRPQFGTLGTPSEKSFSFGVDAALPCPPCPARLGPLARNAQATMARSPLSRKTGGHAART